MQKLRDDLLTDYGLDSEGDEVPADNPHLRGPGTLEFNLTANSPEFMFSGGVRDEAYDTFLELTESNGPFPGFPSIYHDYEHYDHSEDTPGMGAFVTPPAGW